jgi:hypothetical protein
MKFCFHCKRWRTGDSLRCPYCQRTRVRLCPAGHPNPPDANFCQTCGRAELSETDSAPRFLSPLRWILKLAFWIVIVLLGYGLLKGLAEGLRSGSLAGLILPIAFLLMALSICSAVLHFSIGTAILRFLWKLLSRRRR